MRLLSLLLICLFFCPVSYAENILGLSLECENCKITENPCVMLIDSKSFSCEEGLLNLLKKTETGPTFLEIKKYLSEHKVNSQTFFELTRLLEKTNFEVGEDIEQIELVQNFINNAKQEITPKAKFLLLQAVEQVAHSRYESYRRILVRDENLPVLETFKIPQVLSLLLAKSADDAILQAEIERANWLIAKSKSVFPNSYEERDQILLELAEHPLLKNKPTPKVEEVVKQEQKQPQKLQLDPRKFKLVIFLALSLFLIFLVSFYLFKKSPVADASLNDKKDSKMDEILDFFELDENSTEEDLNRNYRKMAKAVHPDMATKNLNYDFHKLQDMYEQARRIVFKLK